VSFLIKGAVREVDERHRYVDTGPTAVNFSPPGTKHAHQILSPSLICLCADFEDEFLMKAGCEALLESPAVFKQGPVITTMLRIQREIRSFDGASDLVLQGLFLQLLGEMHRAGQRRNPTEGPAWLPRACSLLRDRCLENLSIDEISREIGVHPSHLARVFREYLGETPGDYVRKQRLAWAAREIARTTKPINVIAAEAGYSDQAHFARHFKAGVGVAPGEFRRSLRI